jgi:hypothetical protein
MLVTDECSFGADWVYEDQSRTLFACLSQQWQQVDARFGGVSPPNDDGLATEGTFRIIPQSDTHIGLLSGPG